MSELQDQFKDNPYIAKWPADDADVPAYLERVFEGIRQTEDDSFQDLQVLAHEALEYKSGQGYEADAVFQGYLSYWRWHHTSEMDKDGFLTVTKAFAENPGNPHFADYVPRMAHSFAEKPKEIKPLMVAAPDLTEEM